MKKFKNLYFLLFLVIFGCFGNQPPGGILTKKEMVPILVDIHLSEAINIQKFNLTLQSDSLPEDLYLSVCKKHKVERKVLEKSLVYYGKHMREYITVYDEVLNVLSEMELKARKDTLRPVHVGAFDLDTTGIRKTQPPPANADAVAR